MSACSSVERIYFLDPAIKLEEASDLKLDMAYISPRIDEIKGKDMIVGVVDPVRSIKGKKKISHRRDFQLLDLQFEKALSDALWQTDLFHDVGLVYDEEPIREPDLKLALAITEWHEGNGFLRFLLGTWMGATRVQTETVLTDARTGYVYAAFADARAHPGGGIFAVQTWMPERLMVQDLYHFTFDIRDAMLRATHEEPLTATQRDIIFPRPSRKPPTLAFDSDDDLEPKPLRISIDD